jgi:beta-glucosidase
VDLPKIGAILFAGYPGQESGHAIAVILFGDVNPSGKVSLDRSPHICRQTNAQLPFTMGKQVEDWPKNSLIRDLPKSKHGGGDAQRTEQASIRPVPKSVFHEGLTIDYKWFDKQRIAPRWEFGYGLR